VGRAFARLITASRGPSVGRYNIPFTTNGSAQPKASVRNVVAAPRVVGSSGRTFMYEALVVKDSWGGFANYPAENDGALVHARQGQAGLLDEVRGDDGYQADAHVEGAEHLVGL
jgi:hypothetical protein